VTSICVDTHLQHTRYTKMLDSTIQRELDNAST
jgi:hypothetical protein